MSARDPFKVDLRGIVDVLSNHLYTSPLVFVRELLQNSVDAITARRGSEPTLRGNIVIRLSGDGGSPTLAVEDDGIGLDEVDIHTFLSTIGQSSKRDTPIDFLGQFGIGILSCFVVSDEVTLVTRKAGSSTSFRWVGHSDGTYELAPMKTTAPVGTTVYLRPKPDCARMFNSEDLLDAAKRYGGLLPIMIEFEDPDRTDEFGGGPLPWEGLDAATPSGQTQLLAYGQSVFGQPFMAAIPIRSKVADATGVAFLLSEARSGHGSESHHAYLRRMLVSDSLHDLTPDWAYFVRCVVNVNELRPTAGRENFYEDSKLEQFREDLGRLIRTWLETTAARDPDLMADFIRVHYLPLKALASEDPEFYEMFVRLLPFEGTRGAVTMADYLDSGRDLYYVSDHDTYRQLAGVARSLGIELIDGGFTYDSQLLSLAAQLIGREIPKLDENLLLSRLADPKPADNDVARSFMADAERVLSPYRIRPALKEFEPVRVPALLSVSDSVAFGRQVKATRELALPLLAEVLDAVLPEDPGTIPLLVFNFRSELVRALCMKAGRRRDLAIQLIYLHSLMLAHQPLSAVELQLLESATMELLLEGLQDPGPTSRDRLVTQGGADPAVN